MFPCQQSLRFIPRTSLRKATQKTLSPKHCAHLSSKSGHPQTATSPPLIGPTPPYQAAPYYSKILQIEEPSNQGLPNPVLISENGRVNNTYRIATSQYQAILPKTVQAVILDWSGTTADKYVIAPAVVFVDVFEKHGVPITMAEAREPMGLRKDLHINALLEMPSVRQKWIDAKGTAPTPEDSAALFKDFVPLQLAVLPTYATLLPGAAKVVSDLRQQGIQCGSTTGFTRAMVDVLYSEVQKQSSDFILDTTVAGDEVSSGGRPTPSMVFLNCDKLGGLNPKGVIKVDDTVTGIGEGLNAGSWTVGVYKYGNYMGINSLEEEATLSSEDYAQRLEESKTKLIESGAHYVISDITYLPDVVKDINDQLATGEFPEGSNTTISR